jgi:ribose 1,5-bisphosphokinase
VNGSRGYLQQAQRGYGKQLVPVLLRVRPDCLRARLEARGRETPEEIDRRVERAGLQASPMPQNLLTVDNNDRIEDAAEALRSIIESAKGR